MAAALEVKDTTGEGDKEDNKKPMKMQFGPVTVWAAACANNMNMNDVLQEIVKEEKKMKSGGKEDGPGVNGGEDDETTEGKAEEDQGELDSRLITLLNSAKTGDVRTLQKMTTAVKTFLHESNLKKEKRRSVRLLLKQQGFMIPLMVKCLKTNVQTMPAVVSDSLWILKTILDSTDRAVVKEVNALLEAGVIPLLVKLVGGQDTNYGLNGQAIGTLENFALRGCHKQLSASGFGLVTAMTKVVQRKNCSVVLQMKVIHIVSALLGQIRTTSVCASAPQRKNNGLTGYQELMENLPPVGLVKEVIPLLSILLSSKDSEVLGKTLSCLAFGSCVKGSFQYFVDSGIMKKVAPLLTHKDEVVKFFAITSISSVVSLSDERAIQFFNSMKGTFALKDLYKILTSNTENDALVWAADQFFSVAVNAIASEYNVSALNAVITSGFVHALVNCLKLENHEKLVLGSVWAIGRISSEVPLVQRRMVVETGALPHLVELLKHSNEVIFSMAAVSIGNLVHDKPLNRDLVVSLGAIPLLLDLVRRAENSLQVIISVLASLEMIADIRPAPPNDVMKDVPMALVSVLNNKKIKFPEKLVPGIYSIVGKLCEFGGAYIDNVIESGFVPRLQTALTSGSVDTQAFALEAIDSISRGTKEQQKTLARLDMVEVLIDLLQSPVKYIRSLALCVLSCLYKGDIPPECRSCIQKTVPEILGEISKKDPRTNHPAALAFQNVLSHFTNK